MDRVVVFAMPFDSIAGKIKICRTASGSHHAYEAMIIGRALRAVEQIPMANTPESACYIESNVSQHKTSISSGGSMVRLSHGLVHHYMTV